MGDGLYNLEMGKYFLNNNAQMSGIHLSISRLKTSVCQNTVNELVVWEEIICCMYNVYN